MALIACKECGKEVSSEAPTCPHCGIVINKKTDKTTRNHPVIGGVLTLIVITGIWFIYESSKQGFSPYAACNNPETIKEFKSLFDNGAYAQKNKLRVIDLYNIKDVSKGEDLEDRACVATLDLNSGKTLAFKFTYERAKGDPDSFIIKGNVIKSKH